MVVFNFRLIPNSKILPDYFRFDGVERSGGEKL